MFVSVNMCNSVLLEPFDMLSCQDKHPHKLSIQIPNIMKRAQPCHEQTGRTSCPWKSFELLIVFKKFTWRSYYEHIHENTIISNNVMLCNGKFFDLCIEIVTLWCYLDLHPFSLSFHGFAGFHAYVGHIINNTNANSLFLVTRSKKLRVTKGMATWSKGIATWRNNQTFTLWDRPSRGS